MDHDLHTVERLSHDRAIGQLAAAYVDAGFGQRGGCDIPRIARHDPHLVPRPHGRTCDPTTDEPGATRDQEAQGATVEDPLTPGGYCSRDVTVG